ncbi:MULTISPECIES: multiple monosaccharide ABC transporter substrate-binding protein [unclassified Isoptericola]|uniref:multiple monosaccharide ABC transporter substrate-binding protein n=1 Tax=unclassified Isoptericola TaxID=2623355 RepID=UPI00271304FD|nr:MULTISPECIES: multiple monosaccharide ABC transporter substrate-binding protein [unclassified Isoptericola]MDO8143072.1 sugar ABC transporter substrate-binding protein [Isoptericola sp. 178]MDO8150752.1 sugar ABC transporter substrate-binding protein [Isoptericola sp. b408]
MRLGNKMGAVAAGAALTLSLAACGGEGAGSGTDGAAGDGDENVKVGVAMPTQTYERWIQDGGNVEAGLEELGYDVDLQFANDDIPTQTQQIDSMITEGVDVLIIASIDGTALTSQLEAAAAANIPVIAYDRLIRDSENVDFYTTFDNFAVGVAQANALLRGLGYLDENGEPTGEEGPYNIELFAGSPDDNNSHFFFDGAMSVLQPLMDEGVVEVPSGQTDFGQVSTQRWELETAQSRMEDLLTSTYTGNDKKLDGVLAPADVLSRGIINALQGSGMGPTIEEGLPIVTGQDAEIANVNLINDGVQSSTIFKDTRKLADQAVAATQSFVEGEEPEANDTETYDNGVKVVPSYLLEVETVFAEDIEPVLVDSGYYTMDEVESGQTAE